MRSGVSCNRSPPTGKPETLAVWWLHSQGRARWSLRAYIMVLREKQADLLPNSGKAQKLKTPGTEEDEWRGELAREGVFERCKVLPSPKPRVALAHSPSQLRPLVQGPRPSDRAEVEDKEEIRAVDYLKVCLPKGQTCSNQVCTFCWLKQNFLKKSMARKKFGRKYSIILVWLENSWWFVFLFSLCFVHFMSGVYITCMLKNSKVIQRNRNWDEKERRRKIVYQDLVNMLLNIIFFK